MTQLPRIGGFTLSRAIASSDTSVIFHAEDGRGQAAALHVPHLWAQRDDRFRARWRTDVCGVQSIPGLPETVATADGAILWRASAWCEGWELDAVMARCRTRGARIAPSVAASILHAVASALDAMHRSGRIHGRLRAGRVLLSPEGAVYLLGAPAVSHLASTQILARRTPQSASSLSPEQVENSAPTIASDVYALGRLALELLTLTDPFVQSTVDRTETAVLCGLQDSALLQRCGPAAYFIGAAMRVEPAGRPEGPLVHYFPEPAGAQAERQALLAGLFRGGVPQRPLRKITEAGRDAMPLVQELDRLVRADPSLAEPLPALEELAPPQRRSRRRAPIWGAAAGTLGLLLLVGSLGASPRVETVVTVPAPVEVAAAPAAPQPAAPPPETAPQPAPEVILAKAAPSITVAALATAPAKKPPEPALHAVAPVLEPEVEDKSVPASKLTGGALPVQAVSIEALAAQLPPEPVALADAVPFSAPEASPEVPDSLSGSWSGTINRREIRMTLTQTGTSVRGQAWLSMGAEVVEGTISGERSGDALRITVQTADRELAYAGTLSDDTIQGGLSTGSGTRGSWRMRRSR